MALSPENPLMSPHSSRPSRRNSLAISGSGVLSPTSEAGDSRPPSRYKRPSLDLLLDGTVAYLKKQPLSPRLSTTASPLTAQQNNNSRMAASNSLAAADECDTSRIIVNLSQGMSKEALFDGGSDGILSPANQSVRIFAVQPADSTVQKTDASLLIDCYLSDVFNASPKDAPGAIFLHLRCLPQLLSRIRSCNAIYHRHLRLMNGPGGGTTADVAIAFANQWLSLRFLHRVEMIMEVLIPFILDENFIELHSLEFHSRIQELHELWEIITAEVPCATPVGDCDEGEEILPEEQEHAQKVHEARRFLATKAGDLASFLEQVTGTSELRRGASNSFSLLQAKYDPNGVAVHVHNAWSQRAVGIFGLISFLVGLILLITGMFWAPWALVTSACVGIFSTGVVSLFLLVTACVPHPSGWTMKAFNSTCAHQEHSDDLAFGNSKPKDAPSQQASHTSVPMSSEKIFAPEHFGISSSSTNLAELCGEIGPVMVLPMPHHAALFRSLFQSFCDLQCLIVPIRSTPLMLETEVASRGFHPPDVAMMNSFSEDCSEQLLDMLFSSSSRTTALLLTNTEGVIIWASALLAAIFGAGQNSNVILGREVTDFLKLSAVAQNNRCEEEYVTQSVHIELLVDCGLPGDINFPHATTTPVLAHFKEAASARIRHRMPSVTFPRSGDLAIVGTAIIFSVHHHEQVPHSPVSPPSPRPKKKSAATSPTQRSPPSQLSPATQLSNPASSSGSDHYESVPHSNSPSAILPPKLLTHKPDSEEGSVSQSPAEAPSLSTSSDKPPPHYDSLLTLAPIENEDAEIQQSPLAPKEFSQVSSSRGEMNRSDPGEGMDSSNENDDVPTFLRVVVAWFPGTPTRGFEVLRPFVLRRCICMTCHSRELSKLQNFFEELRLVFPPETVIVCVTPQTTAALEIVAKAHFDILFISTYSLKISTSEGTPKGGSNTEPRKLPVKDEKNMNIISSNVPFQKAFVMDALSAAERLTVYRSVRLTGNQNVDCGSPLTQARKVSHTNAMSGNLIECPGGSLPFERQDVIGEGAMSVVYAGSLDGTMVAQKIIRWEKSKAPGGQQLVDGGDENGEVMRKKETVKTGPFEVNFSRFVEISHPHIVQHFFSRESTDSQSCHETSVFMELCENSLKQRLALGRLSGDEIFTIAQALLKALRFLHSRNIVHRDIKVANILIRDEIPKLGDFGTAVRLKDVPRNLEATGTIPYMAPEIALELPYNCAADIFSFGVTLAELLGLSLAHAKEVGTNYAALVAFYRSNRPITIVEEKRELSLSMSSSRRSGISKINQFIESCLHRNAPMRPTAALLLQAMCSNRTEFVNSVDEVQANKYGGSGSAISLGFSVNSKGQSGTNYNVVFPPQLPKASSLRVSSASQPPPPLTAPPVFTTPTASPKTDRH